MADRAIVYQRIDTERDYQDEKWPGTLTVGEFVLLLEEYAAKARREWVADRFPVCCRPDMGVLHVVREVTALGVACMEAHGAPARELM